MNMSERKSKSSSSSDDTNYDEDEYENEDEQLDNFEFGDFDPENKSPDRRSLHLKRTSTANFLGKRSIDNIEKKSYCKEFKEGLREWKNNFYSNIHMENCSSDSLLFYFMFMCLGTFEMFMTFCVFF